MEDLKEGIHKRKTSTLELVAPARDLECGIAAIDHGADAVYIGGPRFSARSSAGNSLEAIGSLVEYGHQFGVKIYLAVNTILRDDELEHAVAMIHDCYSLGVDAAIIQDFGLLECNLPPIALHASTQVNNRSVEKVRFLEETGFSQVVLARELSIEQIRAIADNTSIVLECFVHGALCVSYSGQCYISEVMADRSANRGECAQFCRHAFTLSDRDGKTIEKNRHLLSLRDLCLVDHIESLIDCGVGSFKIEGRMKDTNYVKNCTALYRQKIDEVIRNRSYLTRSSSGFHTLSFTPNEKKTFYRGGTEYCYLQQRQKIGSIYTPKSYGEEVAVLKEIRNNYLEVRAHSQLHNGDGLCYFDAENGLVGFRVNRVSGNRLYPSRKITPPESAVLYRNYDKQFHDLLESSNNRRKLSVFMEIEEHSKGLSVTVTDEDDLQSTVTLEVEKSKAKKPGLILLAAEKQLRRSGNTIFYVSKVVIRINPSSFYPVTVFNSLRRKVLHEHLQKRKNAAAVRRDVPKISHPKWIGEKVGIRDNISNYLARRFFQKCGADFGDEKGVVDLMHCKYCIKAQLDMCTQLNTDTPKAHHPEPYTLRDNAGSYLLHFDCKKCEMIVKKKDG